MRTKILFCIVSQAKSGSTLLRRALNSHPQITCHGEVLSRKSINGLLCKRTSVSKNIQKSGTIVGARQWFNGMLHNEEITELKARVGISGVIRNRNNDLHSYLDNLVYNIENECGL